jgi:hypothetical protein
MSLSILEIVESSLLNIANRYAVLTADPMVEFNILKDFDEQLNDIMERYNKLKGLQSTYTAEELQIKLIEFNLIVQDIQSKINSGFFTGPAGADGLIGLTGPQGPAGAGGEVGPQGPAGEVGSSGEIGPIGLTGPQGPAGADGLIGLTGPQGPAGLNGEVGPQGPAGANGIIGPIGLTGPQGPAGADGLNGLDGSVTFESLTPEQIEILKGETGPQGPAGVDGLNGLGGPVGPQGPIGLNGQDGILDFNSLTAEQKEEIASFVLSSSNPFFSNVLNFFKDEFLSKSLEISNIHYKTNIPASKVFNSKISFVSFDLITNSYVNFRKLESFSSLHLSPVVFTTVLNSGSAGSTTTNRSYVSVDGFLCFQISTPAATFPIVNFAVDLIEKVDISLYSITDIKYAGYSGLSYGFGV